MKLSQIDVLTFGCMGGVGYIFGGMKGLGWSLVVIVSICLFAIFVATKEERIKEEKPDDN